MKKIWLVSILILTFLGGLPHLQAQSEEDFEQAGMKHFENAYFRAIPQKDNARAEVEFAQAERAFKKAIDRNPQRVKPYLHLGRNHFVQKKYQKAAEAYRQEVKVAPQNKRLQLQLASALE